MVWLESEGPGHIWHTVSAWEEIGEKVFFYFFHKSVCNILQCVYEWNNRGLHGLSAARARKTKSRRPKGPPAGSRGLWGS